MLRGSWPAGTGITRIGQSGRGVPKLDFSRVGSTDVEEPEVALGAGLWGGLGLDSSALSSCLWSGMGTGECVSCPCG